MTRVVQVANFVTPTSGGLRTVLNHLALGYAQRGREVVQVLPGDRDETVETAWGRQVFLRAPMVPASGYRVHVQPSRLRAVLAALAPEAIEVHDRTTLRSLGTWAKANDIPSLVVSHERLDRWMAQWLPRRLPLESTADRSNRALAEAFDTVVCTTSWAAEEFHRIGATNVVTVPLGVDLVHFPARTTGSAHAVIRLAMVSRLSKEKRPDLAVETVRELVRRGLKVELLVAGDGPLRAALQRQAAGLPIVFLGHLRDRAAVATLMAGADVLLAPGPVETFGLAALEGLACGTPAVVNHHSALPEVVGPVAGRACASSGFVFADGVLDLLTVDEPVRRAAARRRAEQFTWDVTVKAFLGLHGKHRVSA